ncbi:hypothetical protein ACIQ1D_19615 [Lysinibacillus xylanilyticus]|uniref:hypothetical protein n=1 Tax=Lysinibacillus xylanilyticus TaxID=582475 RepID=UPI00382DD024
MTKLAVFNIRTDKFNTNEITVTFTDGATMDVEASTLLTNSETVVYKEDRTLKAERFTKKYKEAFDTYLFNCKVDVITHEENEKKIVYRVYQVGKKIVAHKCDYTTNEVLSVQDWSYYTDIQGAMMQYKDSKSTYHYKYEFFVLSADMAETTAKAIAWDIERNVPFEMAKSDVDNLVKSIASATNENTVLYAFIIDGEKSIHMAFKYTEGTKENMFKVLSCYNNGMGDRTTYNGLYRGLYTIQSYDKAEWQLRQRANKARGSHAMQVLAF